MAWQETKYGRNAVNRAGQVLIEGSDDAAAFEDALQVLANWRSSHAFPLNTITMDLRQKVNRIQPEALVVQRLKRVRSILAKLDRERGMKLSRMHDLGGCRAVVESVPDVAALRNMYSKSRAIHNFVREYDYIERPKGSGYRSIHLVYRFASRSRPEYNGHLIEIQLRTALQHAWATAVETVGAVLGQALKASEGEESWLDFFKVAGAAFALLEGGNPVPGALGDPTGIADSLGQYFRLLGVREKLDAYRHALKYTDEAELRGAGYFLLVLRPEAGPTLRIVSYSKRNLGGAQREYLKYERELSPFEGGKQLELFPEFADYTGTQAVLVGAESLSALRTSYPNYFLDTEVFLGQLERFIAEYDRYHL